MHFISLLSFAALGYSLPPVSEPPSKLRERQLWGSSATCCEGQCPAELVGDGSPKTWYLHKQIGFPHDCGQNEDNSCDVGEIKSYTIGWSADVGGMIPWASLGFGIQKSVTTGESHGCGTTKNNTVCMFSRTEHIETTQRMEKVFQEDDKCHNQPVGPYRITSPTGAKLYYCVNNEHCESNPGFEYWCDEDEEGKTCGNYNGEDGTD